MKRISILAACQALFSLLQAYLISKISWIGKLGIATIHREYIFLRSGWKTFLLSFGIQMLLIMALGFIERKYSHRQMARTAWLLAAAGIAGFAITYNDLLHTYSHRLLKERFHLAFYLFWIGWLGTCTFFIIRSKKKGTADDVPPTIYPNKPTTQLP